MKPPFIHPTADVSAAADIGDGAMIWNDVQIREGARIGASTIVGKGSYVDAGVVIGDNCKIQNGSLLYAPAVLGDGVFIGPGVILTNDKTPRAINPDMSQKKLSDWTMLGVTIEHGAALGAGTVVLPGINIGRWSMTGSAAVITRDVDPFTLVVGNPGRQVGVVCRSGHPNQLPDQSSFTCNSCGEQINLQAAT